MFHTSRPTTEIMTPPTSRDPVILRNFLLSIFDLFCGSVVGLLGCFVWYYFQAFYCFGISYGDVSVGVCNWSPCIYGVVDYLLFGDEFHGVDVQLVEV